MKKILFIIAGFFLVISHSYASVPSFPMTIYGTITDGTNGLGTGAKITFSDGNNVLLVTYATTRQGWYGFDSTISGVSPTFSEFTGVLKIAVEYQSKSYTLTTIAGSTVGCPSASSIVFTSNVCRYDLVVSSPATPVLAPAGGGSMGGSFGTPLPATPIIVNTGTTLTGLINPPIENTFSGQSLQSPLTITPLQLKKTKVIITETSLKRGTQMNVYRVLPSGRKVLAGKTRVLPNGKIRFSTKIAGNYIFQ